MAESGQGCFTAEDFADSNYIFFDERIFSPWDNPNTQIFQTEMILILGQSLHTVFPALSMMESEFFSHHLWLNEWNKQILSDWDYLSNSSFLRMGYLEICWN